MLAAWTKEGDEKVNGDKEMEGGEDEAVDAVDLYLTLGNTIP